MRYLHANINGIHAKSDELHVILEAEAPTIITLNETKLSQESELATGLETENLKYLSNFHIFPEPHPDPSNPPFLGSSIYSSLDASKIEFSRPFNDLEIITAKYQTEEGQNIYHIHGYL